MAKYLILLVLLVFGCATAKYKIGDCVHEIVSDTTLRIIAIDETHYYYTTYQSGLEIGKSRKIINMDQDHKLERCGY